MRTSTGVTAVVLVIMSVAGLAGCGTPEERATDLADELAAKAHVEISPGGVQPVEAEFVARHAIDHGYKVLKVDGQDTKPPVGVTITILITSTVPNRTFWQTDGVEFTFCYELWYGGPPARAPKRVPCPDSAPVSYAPLPPDPAMPTPDELRAVLEKAGADENAVRQGIAGLDLDQSIRVQVRTGSGHVGAALRWDRPRSREYRCVLGRIGPSGVQTWVPARVYLQPGEMACTGEEAASGTGQRPPH